MPLIGFVMKGKDGATENVPLDTVLKRTKEFGLPAMILAGIIKSSQYRGTSISATTLTGCMRRTYWERTKDYYADPKDLLYKAFRGSMVHAILETIARERVQIPGEDGIRVELAIRDVMKRYIPEMRFYRIAQVDGEMVDLSGQVDLMELIKPSMNGKKTTVEIQDYKTAEPYAVKKYGKEGLNPEHVFQVNFYRWLVAPHFNVQSARLYYIGYGFAASSGSITAIKEYGRISEVYLPPVPLWEEEEFLEKAIPLVMTMREAFKLGVVPPANPGDKQWRCRSCPFVKECDRGIDLLKDETPSEPLLTGAKW